MESNSLIHMEYLLYECWSSIMLVIVWDLEVLLRAACHSSHVDLALRRQHPKPILKINSTQPWCLCRESFSYPLHPHRDRVVIPFNQTSYVILSLGENPSPWFISALDGNFVYIFVCLRNTLIPDILLFKYTKHLTLLLESWGTEYTQNQQLGRRSIWSDAVS